MALKTKPLAEVRAAVPVKAAASGERTQVSFSVDKQIHSTWKKLAIDQRVTLQQLVVNAMTEYQKTIAG